MFISKIKNKIFNFSINNFVGTFLVFIFLFSSIIFFDLKLSYAQNSAPCLTPEDIALGASAGQPCITVIQNNGTTTNVTTINTTSNQASVTTVENKPLATTFCEDLSWTNGIVGGVKQAGCYIVYGLMKVILEVIGGFARLSAGLFDLAVDGYVLNIKTLFLQDGVSGQDKAWLYNSWAVIRDVTNILMFFSAMYIGVRYILGSEELDFKKSLIKIIIFAVFVNFSFAFSKFAIDISNFISLSIRGGITGYSPSAKLSDILINYTGISSLVTEVASFTPRNFTGYTNWTTMALAIVFLAATFFVFLYAAIMILLRAIVLLVCVIFSPLMFLTTSFKSMEKINQLWRDNFIGQLLFGPVLMLGLWVSFGFLKATKEISGGADITSIQNAAGAVNGSASMILAILALLLAVFAANKVSTGLGGAIGGFVGSGMKNIGLGVATGGAGFAIRGVAGRAGAAIASSKWLKDKAQNGNFISRRVASGMSLAGDKMANAKVTIGGKSSMSTADKNNQAKEKQSKAEDEYFRNNKKAIRDSGKEDEFQKARGDKNKMAVLMASIDPKNKGKTEAQLRKDLGLGMSDGDIDLAKARKLENKDNLKADRVSSGNADAYLDAKEVSSKRQDRMDKAEVLRKDRLDNIEKYENFFEEELKQKQQQEVNSKRAEIENIKKQASSPTKDGSISFYDEDSVKKAEAELAKLEENHEMFSSVNKDSLKEQLSDIRALQDKNRQRSAEGLQKRNENVDQYKNTTMMAKVETKLSDALRGRKSNSTSHINSDRADNGNV